jgi:hypothetical protein
MSTTTTPRSAAPGPSVVTPVPKATPLPPHPGAGWVARVARPLARLASWRVWCAGVAVYVPFTVVFFGAGAPFAVGRVEKACGRPPLDVRFTSTAADVHGFLAACGPAGREAYRAMQLADLVYPSLFALVMASSLALVVTRLVPHRPVLVALAAVPFIASAFDYLENLFAWLALASFPGAGAADPLLGWASAAKTTTSWVAGSLLVAGLAALALRPVLRRTHRGAAARG